jgi:hypothetical protein
MAEGMVRVFSIEFTLEDAIGSHACSLQASRLVIPRLSFLSGALFLPIHSVNCVQTLKVCGRGPPIGSGMHFEQWKVMHDAAVLMLASHEWATQPVAVHCELQILLEPTRRKCRAMREVLLVADAADANQLFSAIQPVPGIRTRRSTTDNLLVAAAAGMVTTVERLLVS